MLDNSRRRGDGTARKSKIQSLIIRHLRENGSLDLLLPDGIVLEIGITQVGKDAKPHKSDDYCFVAASRDNRRTMIDSYNLGLSFEEENNTIVFDDSTYGSHGEPIRRLDVI